MYISVFLVFPLVEKLESDNRDIGLGSPLFINCIII